MCVNVHTAALQHNLLFFYWQDNNFYQQPFFLFFFQLNALSCSKIIILALANQHKKRELPINTMCKQFAFIVYLKIIPKYTNKFFLTLLK